MKQAEWLAYFDKEETDVLVYCGPISRGGYDAFSTQMGKKKRPKLLMILATLGGDPHSGYRIARAAMHHYGKGNFTILLPAFCKSAGTLICIGAGKLIMLDKSELGPLDVQIQKGDEIFKLSSGLDIMRGMSYLQTEALQAFAAYLVEISGSGLSTSITSDISSKLVSGLFGPLFAQIDPVKLGEMSAAVQIANEYGTRLDAKAPNSLQQGALQRLINDYPAHGFVIDRAEAKQLFSNIESPNEQMRELGAVTYGMWSNRLSSEPPLVLNFVQTLENYLKETNHVEPELADDGGDGASRSPDQPGENVDAANEPLGQHAGEHAQEQPPVGDEQADA